MAHPQLNTTVLEFDVSEVGATAYIIDCARALSLYNRRSYRSGYVYSIDYIEFIPTFDAVQNIVAVAKIPESYSVLGAYKMGFNAWRRQRANALEESEFLAPGKWSDFKCWYSVEHMDQSWPELMPRAMGTGMTSQALDTGGSEWNRATIEFNDVNAATVTEIEVGMLGDDNLVGNYGSLMHQYGVTRTATLSPDPLLPQFASGAWITAMGEESGAMSTAVIDLVEDENDEPPYANQADVTQPPTYVGNGLSAPRGVIVDTGVTGTTGRSINLAGGLFPLGLVAIVCASVDPFTIRVHMSRGSYKGVAAKSMGSFR